VRFGALARARGDVAFADVSAEAAAELARNIEEHGWDGEWYLRAYFDSGEPLGSSKSPECQIDSLPQSWAALSRVGDPERTRKALASLDRRLVRRDLGLVQLFDPPFDTSGLEPGYVKGYAPGVRENGGQYTHAAVWIVMALAQLGSGDEAAEVFHMLNPLNHARNADGLARYQLEPYAVAGDVYSHPAHRGRGGWSWYTGSAGWMYRAGIESMLGLRRSGSTFTVDPCIPAGWPSYRIVWKYLDTTYNINVTNPDRRHRGVKCATLDGAAVDYKAIALVNDGQVHEVAIRL
jgi:cyclic beta-1,2-glucan synthetase